MAGLYHVIMAVLPAACPGLAVVEADCLVLPDPPVGALHPWIDLTSWENVTVLRAIELYPGDFFSEGRRDDFISVKPHHPVITAKVFSNFHLMAARNELVNDEPRAIRPGNFLRSVSAARVDNHNFVNKILHRLKRSGKAFLLIKCDNVER